MCLHRQSYLPESLRVLRRTMTHAFHGAVLHSVCGGKVVSIHGTVWRPVAPAGCWKYLCRVEDYVLQQLYVLPYCFFMSTGHHRVAGGGCWSYCTCSHALLCTAVACKSSAARWSLCSPNCCCCCMLLSRHATLCDTCLGAATALMCAAPPLHFDYLCAVMLVPVVYHKRVWQ